jgi:hypothetical protein
MRVYYDFELKHSLSIKDLTELKYDSFNGIREFVITKLKALKGEIEFEELIDDKKKIIICALNSTGPCLTYSKYSNDLVVKMDSCLTPEDLAYIQTKLSNSIGLYGLSFLSNENTFLSN